jgi:hypothetical protein
MPFRHFKFHRFIRVFSRLRRRTDGTSAPSFEHSKADEDKTVPAFARRFDPSGEDSDGQAAMNSTRRRMNFNSRPGFAHSIQGQLLRQSERHEVAIFLRDGALWVADFIDGDGRLVEATTWFRFNCGPLSSSHAQRRLVLESAIPLSEELAERIERLHPSADARNAGTVALLLESVAAHLLPGRLASVVASRLRRRGKSTD